MALALYLLVTAAILSVWSRRMQPLARAAALALVLLPLLFTGRAMMTNRVYAPIDLPFQYEPFYPHAKAFGIEKAHDIALSDLHCQIIPWQKAVRWSLAQGEWPLWNPFILCGDVLAAAAQPAVYDPLTWIAMLLPLPHALTFGAAMTFFLAGFFTFAFSRACGRGEVASLFAAATYMFGGMFAFYVGWPLARAWSFLPFVLFGVHRLIRERRFGALACAFVLTIVAGHPESVLHVVFLGASYGVFLKGFREIPRAVLAGVIALLLSAVYLLPFAEAAEQTFEHDIRSRLYAPTPYGQLIDNVRREHRIGRTFLPYYDGLPWRGETSKQWDPLSARAGTLALALAIAAVIVAPRRGETWFWLVLGGACMNASFGGWPVAHWLHELPLFEIAINERLGFGAVLAMAMLAAIVIDALGKGSRVEGPAASDVGSIEKTSAANHDAGDGVDDRAVDERVTVDGGVTVDGRVRGEDLVTRDDRVAGNNSVPGDRRASPGRRGALIVAGVLALVAVAIFIYAKAAPVAIDWEILLAEIVPPAIAAVMVAARVRWVGVALLALLLVQRAIVDGGIYPALPASAFFPDVLPEGLRERGEARGARVAGVGYTLIPNTGAMYGLEDVRGYEAMTNKRLVETYPLWSRMQTAWFNVIDDPSRPFLDFLNVGTFITGREVAGNDRVLPRAFVPRAVRYEKDGARVLEAMKAATDFGERAWIEVAENDPSDTANGPGRVSVKRIGTRYELDAEMENDGWVVVSETAWKGWRAYVDGKRVQPRFANHAFLGVHVPRGRHRVRLVYLPESFTRGRNITLATIAVLIVSAFVSRRRRRSLRTPA